MLPSALPARSPPNGVRVVCSVAACSLLTAACARLVPARMAINARDSAVFLYIVVVLGRDNRSEGALDRQRNEIAITMEVLVGKLGYRRVVLDHRACRAVVMGDVQAALPGFHVLALEADADVAATVGREQHSVDRGTAEQPI